MACYFQKTYGPEVEQLLRQYHQSLSEKDRRRFAAVEAITLGQGGMSYISDVLGCDPETIQAGMQELKQLPDAPASKVVQTTAMSRASVSRELQELEHLETTPSNALLSPQSVRRKARVREQYRIRRPGGGRKSTEEKPPTLVVALEQMLHNENEIAGDPMGEQQWVRSSTRRLSERLQDAGHQVSHSTVGRLLKDRGFSLRTNKRKQASSKHPERDKQFKYIASQRQTFTVAGLPIISVDTKKKELIGDYRNNGQVWCREAEEVNEHDFPDTAECRAVPFGI